MRKVIWLVVLAVLMNGGIMSALDFEVTDGKELKVSLGNAPFILGESVIPEVKCEANVSKLQDGTVVWNVFGKANPDFPFRREAVVNRGGTEVEFSVMGRADSYNETLPVEMGYSVDVDVKRYAGGTYHAVGGRTQKPVESNGVIGEDGTFKPLLVNARVLVLTAKDGKDSIVFDFNPEGVTNYTGPSSKPGGRGVWGLSMKEGILKCSAFFKRDVYGGVLTAKALVYRGTKETWLERHALTKYSYCDPLVATGNFAFGDNTVGKMYQQVNGLFKADVAGVAGAGWEGAAPSIVTKEKSGAVYSAACGNGTAVFRVSGLKPGFYLVTARFTAYDEKRGPFSAKIGGAQYLENASLDAGTVGVATRIVHLDETARLELFGDWQLSTLALQLEHTDYEDYRFRRGFWRAAGLWEPTVALPSKNYLKEPEYTTDFGVVALAPYDCAAPEGYVLNLKKEVCQQKNNDEMAWRYDSLISGMGLGNGGSFLEWDTQDKIDRRLDELKGAGITTILMSSALSRHTFPYLAPAADAFFKRMAPAAHARGMKVLDHQDFSLLWLAGDGMRVAVPHPGALQQAIDDATGTRGYCLNNEKYSAMMRKEYLRQVKEWDLDGIMIDEVYFFHAKFCACPDCRRKFTRDTGLHLPMDETSKELFNKNSILWRVFQQWRIKCVGDWFVELRKTVSEVKPNFSLMVYTTHYGWGSTYSSLTKGAALPELARCCDFLGTEIMSRNVIAARRPVMAFRKMKNTLANYAGIPIFGLVYPQGSYDIAEFGWGLNNVANQVTWAIGTFPKPENADGDFQRWKMPVQRRYCKPAARIALLYSTNSKDYARNCAYNTEALGMGELLNDLGIQYEYILEESLADLSNYSVLLVMNAGNLSDDTVAKIRVFAEAGGTVYLSAHAGVYNELAVQRKKWPFADVFNATLKLPIASTKVDNLESTMGAYAAGLNAFRFIVLKGGVKGDVLVTSKGRNESPVVISAPYGKGRIIYSRLTFGSILNEDESSAGGKVTWNPSPELLSLGRNLMKKLFAEESIVKYEEVPEGVLSSIYIENAPGGKPRYVLHLLNGTGIELKAGQTIPANAPKGTWSPIQKDLVFDFAPTKKQVALTGEPKQAMAVSPDFKGQVQCSISKTGDSTWRITMPSKA
ncbi:MAG: hypothetical protein J5746_10280, partial [Victivallales bacterium]|nr:hypothetical protein [Victivallales bacterium]